MHKLKKLVHKAGPTQKEGQIPKDAECEDLKHKLEIFSSALHTSAMTMKRTEANWKDIFNTEYKTMEELSQRYPDPDSVRDTSKMYAEAATRMQSEFSARSAADVEYNQLVQKVNHTVAQIKALDPFYKQLEDFRVEYEMYNQKFSALDVAKEKKQSEKMDDKVSRNAEKLEKAKTDYETKLNEVVGMQRKLWSSREPAYRAAYTAYFLLQAHMMDIMDKHSQGIYKYATSHERDVETLTLHNITI